MMQQELEGQHGKQAKVINKMLDTPNLKGVELQEKLVELLGHTPMEVFVDFPVSRCKVSDFFGH